MNETKTLFRVRDVPWEDRLHVHFAIQNVHSGDRMLATEVKYEGFAPGAALPAEPALRLSMEDATGLMDELWRAGVRPTDPKRDAGELAATKYHLEDMRKLAFGVSGVVA